MCESINFPHNYSEFCYRFIRGLLYAFLFILCILALSLIIFSFWYIFEGENYHMDSKFKSVVFSVSFIFGLILLVLSVFGLSGVLRESLFLSKAFLFGMSILVLFEIICILLIYTYRQHIIDNASLIFQSFITQYSEDDDIRGLVDKIQTDMKCCGISSINDWDLNSDYNCSSLSTFGCSVPASCCVNFKIENPKMNMLCGIGLRNEENSNIMYKLIHTTGCKYAINSFLEYKHHLTALISIGFLIPQVIGIILIIAFISILHFLIVIEYDRNRILYGQFKQNTNDVKNTSKFIKLNLGNEKFQFIKKINSLSKNVVKKKPNANIYQIKSY